MIRLATLALLVPLAAQLPFSGSAAHAQLAISAGDNKPRLVDGVPTIQGNPAPDMLTLLDLTPSPPRVLGEVAVPHSVAGPPNSLAITPDSRFAIVPSNQRIDPANPTRTIYDNRLSVVDLTARPPRVVQTLEVGAGPAGVSINRAGTHVLVAHRGTGDVTLFRLANGQLSQAASLNITTPAAIIASAVFTPDGKHALVTRYGEAMVSVITIEGDTLTRTGRDITTGVNPYGLVIGPSGRFAVVANIGRGSGDSDTISYIDLAGPVATWRVTETVTVGQTPEGLALSRDGNMLAVTVMNGSNKPAASPFRGDGQVQLWRIARQPARGAPHLSRVAVGTVGHWSQGAGFSGDGHRLVVQNMVEQDLSVFRIEGNRLVPMARIPLPAGPASMAVAPR